MPKDVLEPMDVLPIVAYDEDAAKDRAATAIQARARGLSSRKVCSAKEQEQEQEQRERAATLVQASLRGHSSRKQKEHEAKAAIQIQATVRSQKAKRTAEEVKVVQRTRSESAAAFERECRERNAALDRELEQAEKVTWLQSLWRGFSGRKQTEKQLAAESLAIVKLQASVRSLKAKRELEEAKAVQRARSESAAAYERECRERNAALDQLLEQEGAVKAVQAAARGKAVRFEQGQQRQAAVKVQAALRRKDTASRLEILKAQRAAQAADADVEKKKEEEEEEEEEEQGAAATRAAEEAAAREAAAAAEKPPPPASSATQSSGRDRGVSFAAGEKGAAAAAALIQSRARGLSMRKMIHGRPGGLPASTSSAVCEGWLTKRGSGFPYKWQRRYMVAVPSYPSGTAREGGILKIAYYDAVDPLVRGQAGGSGAGGGGAGGGGGVGRAGEMSGWLEKRSGGKEGERSMSAKALGREHWNQRWFVLSRGVLSYFKTDVEAQLVQRGGTASVPLASLDVRESTVHLMGDCAGKGSTGSLRLGSGRTGSTKEENGASGGSGAPYASGKAAQFTFIVTTAGRELRLRCSTAAAYHAWATQLGSLAKRTTADVGAAPTGPAEDDGAPAKLKGEFELHAARRAPNETLGIIFDMSMLKQGASAPGRTMLAKAASAAERDRWVEAISKHFDRRMVAVASSKMVLTKPRSGSTVSGDI
jgi:hypothetical protein